MKSKYILSYDEGTFYISKDNGEPFPLDDISEQVTGVSLPQYFAAMNGKEVEVRYKEKTPYKKLRYMDTIRLKEE